MRLDNSTLRRRRLSLTSLIDVIFLLLLFFMLTSTFTKFGKVDINGSGGQSSSAVPVDVFIAITDDLVRINGQQVEQENIAAHLTALAAEDAKAAILQVSRDTTSQMLVQTLLTIRRGSPISVTVAR